MTLKDTHDITKQKRGSAEILETIRSGTVGSQLKIEKKKINR